MRIHAALILLALALPAAAAPAPAKKILADNVDLIVTVSVNGPGGAITSKSRVQAQSQFNSALEMKTKTARKLNVSGVPVINPNNGKARMEYKGRASWGGDDAVEFMSAIELEVGAEALVYDAEGVTVRIKITAAD